METKPPPKEKITLGLCLLQPNLRAPDEDLRSTTQRILNLGDTAMADHPDISIDLFVLPELCPLGYSEDTFAKYLPTSPEKRKLLCEVDAAFRAAAIRWKAAICYGTIGWKPKEVDPESYDYYIRQNVIDSHGELIASYDKIHLCEYGECSETRFFTPGRKAVSFLLHGWKVGLMVCADLRDPMLSRTLVRNHAAEVLLQPACMVRDESFRTWASFRETRAVENGVYLVAGNYAGSEYGKAAVIPPWIDGKDHEPQELGAEEECLVTLLDRRVLTEAWTTLPFRKRACEGRNAF